jgi:ATP-dependent DNA helicase RecG
LKGELPAANAAKFARLGIRSIADLVLHLPLRYEDETRLAPITAASGAEPVLVEARVRRAEVMFRPKRQLVVTAEAPGSGALLTLRFFHFYASQLGSFERAAEGGRLVRAFGVVRPGRFGAEMVHPRWRLLQDAEPLAAELTPVYPTTAGIGQALLRRLTQQALAETPLDDTVDAVLRKRYALADFAPSVRLLHRPPPGTDLEALERRSHAAWRRIKFDELLAQQLSMRLAYRARRARRAPPLAANGPLLRRFLARLPFALTRAQQRVIGEILHDLGQPHPMQRLVQGDVGSGKTIVAAIACLAAADARWQAAVMAPTEILAEQHRRKFSEWLAPLGVRLAWLHGELSRAAKRRAWEAIASGEADVVIGTHALFQDAVGFARLGLAVVDEQHRFGVQQRLALRKKAAARARATPAVPHQLMMSATPIPRTLSMSYYADLDVSLIDELPPGRRAVRTRLVAAGRRADVLARIRAACEEGQQAYWICPVIEESQQADLRAAVATFETLQAELGGLRVGLLHGRLAAEDKAAVMAAFAQGTLQLLVATTVIEVGVDVPNASLMVVEHAERFGLAQLHQLRGRIGRGARESVCILLYAAPLSEAARERLKVIYENADGFEVARHDLMLRGPGEFLGERQSGAPLLRFADLSQDGALIDDARAAAEWMLEHRPREARRHVARWLPGRQELLRV